MKKTNSKEIIAKLLTSIERLVGIKPPKVTVLLFHSVSSDNTLIDIKAGSFAFQLNYLRKHFDFISLDSVVKYTKGQFTPSHPSVALTFDDGYQDILKNVIPVLEKYKIPATFFVVADPQNVRRSELENYKKLLNLKDLKKIDSELFSIGSHTLTHIDLKNCNLELGVKEMKESKRILGNILNKKISHFAYPKGAYTKEISKKAAQIYSASFNTKPGVINQKTKSEMINRIGVDRTISNIIFPSLFTYWIIFYFNAKPLILEFIKLGSEIINYRPGIVLGVSKI